MAAAERRSAILGQMAHMHCRRSTKLASGRLPWTTKSLNCTSFDETGGFPGAY